MKINSSSICDNSVVGGNLCSNTFYNFCDKESIKGMFSNDGLTIGLYWIESRFRLMFKTSCVNVYIIKKKSISYITNTWIPLINTPYDTLI